MPSAGVVPCCIDAAVSLADGLWIVGWVLAADIKSTTVTAGTTRGDADLIVRYWRQDVADHFGIERGNRPLLGFVVRVPVHGLPPKSAIELQFQTSESPATAKAELADPAQTDFANGLRAQWPLIGPALIRAHDPVGLMPLLRLMATPIGDRFGKFQFFVEPAISTGNEGLLVNGWAVDPDRELRHLYLSCSRTGRVLGDLATHWARTPRADVSERHVGTLTVGQDPGFIAWLPCSGTSDTGVTDHLYALAVLKDGRIARQDIKPSPALGPMASVQHVLRLFTESQPRLGDILESHVGPAIDAIWRHRTRSEPRLARQDFGSAPAAPDISVIVPLYGRYDFMRHQLAVFVDDPAMERVELIYVIDDPNITTPALQLAEELSGLFRLPFSVISYNENLGFAGANNVAARIARGRVLILLNSDVMPVKPGWAPALAEQLARLPEAGIVGTTLLYEDGSLQHAGLQLRRLARWAGLPVNIHPGKGLSYISTGQSRQVSGVTAACMTIHRKLYQELGGLDEGFILGDFEDSDMCFRASAKGHKIYCADVPMYHLERQSQSLAGDSWKHKVTLYNCWRHSKRLPANAVTSK